MLYICSIEKWRALPSCFLIKRSRQRRYSKYKLTQRQNKMQTTTTTQTSNTEIVNNQKVVTTTITTTTTTVVVETKTIVTYEPIVREIETTPVETTPVEVKADKKLDKDKVIEWAAKRKATRERFGEFKQEDKTMLYVKDNIDDIEYCEPGDKYTHIMKQRVKRASTEESMKLGYIKYAEKKFDRIRKDNVRRAKACKANHHEAGFYAGAENIKVTRVGDEWEIEATFIVYQNNA